MLVNKKELIINSDCVYISALNSKNAIRKFNKSKRQVDYYDKEPLMRMDMLDLF